jgi:hypothetical protein
MLHIRFTQVFICKCRLNPNVAGDIMLVPGHNVASCALPWGISYTCHNVTLCAPFSGTKIKIE